jgi:D-glycero-D-manno-heptose 1,7-bisphosphate phosphatase
MIHAVVFDCDGTLIADTPHQRDRIVPMPQARRALTRLREIGLRIGVATNQPGADARELRRFHDRVEALLGPIDGWFVCTHTVAEGCTCRKPQPGLILEAAAAFGIAPDQCAVIGDIGSDVEAAQNAGACAILVPTPVTLREEIERAPIVCDNVFQAVEQLVGAAA